MRAIISLLVVSLPFYLASRILREREGATPAVDDKGRAVRAALYRAYSAMMHRRAPYLWRLTACLGQESVPAGVAVLALELTVREFERWGSSMDTTPLQDAIEEISRMQNSAGRR